MPRKRSSSRSSESSVEIISKRSSNRPRGRSRSSSSSESSSRPKSGSRSSKYQGPRNKISELDKERTKNYDFTDEINELHSNEKLREKTINKLEDGGGFKPQSFKSSRSDKKRNESSKFKQSSSNENSTFGTGTSFGETITRNADLLLNPGIVNSSNKSILSDLFFEDPKVKQNRWRLKVKEILQS